MENKIFAQAAKFLRERRDNRRWRAIVFCLAVVVVGTTAWVLSRNGQAFTSSGAELDCPVVVHEHTSACFNGEGELICGKADYVFHTHNNYCYDGDNQLVCELKEVEKHEHTAACFETITIMDGTVVNSENGSAGDEGETSVNALASSGESSTLVCDKEEHTHDDSCYESTEGSLTCSEEENHTHGENCYESTRGSLTCGEEENHTHGENCYEGTEGSLTCSKEENHTHGENCYESTRGSLTCGKEENHTHGENCYEGTRGSLICDKEEHTHSDRCYETQQVSGETKPDEGEKEEKPENSTKKVRKLVCGKKGAHIHSEECYDGGKLICDVPVVSSVEEHTHDQKCFRTGADEEFKKIYRDDTIVVTAVYTGLAQIPEAAELRVDMIPETSSDYENDLAELTETEGALVEDSELAMLLQIGFYTTDERIVPKDTVHFTVQFLEDGFCEEGDEVTVACFAKDGVELIPATDIDEEIATEFDLDEFADLDLGIIIGGEHDRKRVLTYKGAGYIMSIALEEDTKISKDAELTIDQLTQENNPEGYAERLAQLGEKEGLLAGEDDMEMLLRVWISDNGRDTGLEEKAEVSVQFLDDKIYAEGDAVMVASFVDDDVRLISGTDIDEEGTTTFEVEELSELAFLAPGERADVLTYEGEDYIVTVALGAATKVPEGAELMVEEITKESNPALYAERLAQLESVSDMLGEENMSDEEDVSGKADMSDEEDVPGKADMSDEEDMSDEKDVSGKEDLSDEKDVPGKEDVLGKEEIMAALLHMWVSLDGEEIALDETVDVTVQFINSEIYFEEDTVKAAHFTEEDGRQYLTMLEASDIDADISTTFVSEGLGDFAFITEDVRTLTYEGEDFIVTVRFHEAAQIPDNAELFAERITEESDPEHFSERVDTLQEQAEDGKYITMNLLMKIGFYVGDKEVEPQDTVDVKIQMLNRENLDMELEEDNPPKIVHFAEDGLEMLEDADVVEDEDNSLTTTFLIDSFSDIAMYSNSDGITTAKQFHEVMEKAKDGDTIVIGANIEFRKPNRTYTRDTRPGDGRVPETDDLFYKGYYVGDTGEVIIAKLLTSATYGDHKHITLDLNGYTLRLLGDNMTLIDVCWGTELTVMDSWAEKSEEEKAADPRPDVYSIDYQITTAEPVDSSSGLTRETTETRTASGGAMVGNGYREDFWQDDGAHANEQGSGGNRAAVITMWFGKLNFKSGIIAENANRAIRCRAGEINLDGGYLLNNAAKGDYPRDGENKYTYGTSDPRWYGYYGGALGGAVVCEEVPGWYSNWVNVTIDPDTGVAPRAPGTINLTGTVLSGNRALQGGAIHATGCNINITGGYVTHNRAFFRYWGGGGGGIKVDGPIATQQGKIVGSGDFTMTGGQITANEAAGGGGGICISRKANVRLKGGFIAGNTTTSGTNGEGGGVALYEEWTKIFIDTVYEEITNEEDLPKDENGNTIWPVKPEKPAEGFYVTTAFAPTAYIGDPSGGGLYITNNHSRSETDWGGGGLFVSEGATAYLYNVLITENKTEGFGGGLSGCATGRILDFTTGEKGAAIFGNSASGNAYAGDTSAKHEDRDYTKKETNPIFWERDTDGRYFFQDYFSALYSKLGDGMIGGGSENWDGSMDGERLSAVKKDEEGKWRASYVAGLTAHPTEADKQKAKQYTRTYITGNTSATHGGGVMCNGIISIGEGKMEITSAMQLRATKAIQDGNQTITTMLPGQFSFTVYAETSKTAPWQEIQEKGVEAKLGDIVSVGTNDANGNIEFNKLLTIQKTGWVRFFLVEDKVSDQPANMGIATDDHVYCISIYVQKVTKQDPQREYYDIKQINLERGWLTELSDGTYFKWATGAEGRWIYVDGYDHGYTNDQLYHSEDHPLILDLTKGVMKYDWPAYHVVVPYQYAPQYTFTNVKKGTTRLVVEKKWDDGVPVEDRKPVLVRLYKKWIDASTGKLYKEEGLWGAPTLSQDGVVPWAWQWEGLETKSSDGKYKFEYYVKEERVGPEEDNRINDYTVQYEYGYLPDVNGTPVDQVIITNSPKTYGIELMKCDEEGESLPGAQFVISTNKDINVENIQNDPNVLSFVQENGSYVYCGNTKIGGRVSKILATSGAITENNEIEAGKISISGMTKGTYYLIEIAAPLGYLPVEAHKITLDGTGNLKIECDKGSGCKDCNVQDNTKDPDVLYIKLTDEAEKYSLPKTGGLGANCKNILGVVAMSGMIALIYMTCRRRKEEAGR